jgi:hypothetical protein
VTTSRDNPVDARGLGSRLRDLRERIPPAWRLAGLAYLATRLPLLLFAVVIEHYAPPRLRPGHFLFHGGEPHSHWLVDAFQKWDAYWFLNIVREGYQFYGPIEQVSGVVAGIPETNVTPFPLYPMLMAAGGWLIGDPAVAGLLLSQVALIGSFALLYRLVRLDDDEAQARRVVWFFAAVPWGYAFSAIYSESVFFFLTLAAIYAVRRDRLVLGGVAGMLAALSRLNGVLIALPMLIELWRRWRARRVLNDGTEDTGGAELPEARPLSVPRALFALALVPAGTLGYFAYLWWLTGEPNAYFIGQQGWHKSLVPPWTHLVEWLTSSDLDAEDRLDIATAIVVGLTLALSYGRIRASYWAYFAASFAVLMSSSYLLGLPRYAAGLFPIYFAYAAFERARPEQGRALLICFAAMSPLIFWVWTRWSYAF